MAIGRQDHAERREARIDRANELAAKRIVEINNRKINQKESL